jgi:UDP-N-acetylglucosamine 2-epimerase (non-hydrolysing)
MKILVVFGTRPEAIKMAPLVHALRASPALQTVVCVTAQHRQMLDQVLELFQIKPDIDLNLMRAGQDLSDITSRVLLGMRDVIKEQKPAAVLVHGDTTTALASAMAAFYESVPVGHVEAGLRTHNVHAPFPEEFNRQVISKIAHWHFAPTALSKDNLLAEGVKADDIMVTGNTVIDALQWVSQRIDQDQLRQQQLDSLLKQVLDFDWTSQRFILITGHRRENFGEGFLNICKAIRELATEHPTTHFVYPVHLNPNVQEPVYRLLRDLPNVHLISPLDYEPFAYLLRHCYLVLTDSGGIQEEAPSLGKPVLVMRETTERPEAVQAGTVRLVGSNTASIIKNVTDLLTNRAHHDSMAKAHNPYGDGKACERIMGALTKGAHHF